MLQQFTGYLYSFSGSQNYQLLCELPQSHKIWSPVEAWASESSITWTLYQWLSEVDVCQGADRDEIISFLYPHTENIPFLGTNTKVSIVWSKEVDKM